MKNTLKCSTLILALSCMVSHGATVVNLGSAQNYTILTKAGITNTVTALTSISGNIATSPIASTSITGFDLQLDASGEFSTSVYVTGRVYAANYSAPTPSILTVAVLDMEAAYTDATGRIDPDFLNLLGGNLNGQILDPGLYKWESALSVTDSITFNGDANDIWVLQVDNRFNLQNDAQIILSGGALASNIFWQTVEGATFGTNSHFEGILLTATDIAVQTGATVNGNLYAQTAVTLDANTVVQAIPEPSTSILLIGGLVALIRTRRR